LDSVQNLGTKNIFFHFIIPFPSFKANLGTSKNFLSEFQAASILEQISFAICLVCSTSREWSAHEHLSELYPSGIDPEGIDPKVSAKKLSLRKIKSDSYWNFCMILLQLYPV
jgi:hypothetical protein